MAQRQYFTIFLTLVLLTSSAIAASEEIGDVSLDMSQYFEDLNEATRRSKPQKMEVSRTAYLEVDWIFEEFENSLLLFTGATDLFNFQSFSKAPYIHVNQCILKQTIYNNRSTDQLVLSVSKTVRQQVVVCAVIQCAMDRISKTFEEKTSIHPQTLIVFNTLKLSTHVLESQFSVLHAFLQKGRPMMYVLNLDLETNVPGDGHLICQFCSFNKHVFAYAPEQKSKQGQQLRMVKFQWNVPTAGRVLKQVRALATDNGRNLEWLLLIFQFMNLQICDVMDRDFTNANPLARKGHKSILKQHPFRLVVLQTLFPLRNVSLHSINFHCQAKVNKDKFDTTHFSRGLSFHIHHSEYQLLIRYVSSSTKEEDEIIFVTSENVRLKGGKNPTDLYYNVFDCQVWHALLVCLLVSALAYSLLVSMGRTGTSRRSLFVEGRQGIKLTFDFFYERVVGLLGQGWSSRLHGNSRAIVVLTVPWHFAAVVLVFWYTSYMNSSFSFIFPYELDSESWRDFENYSLYILFARQNYGKDIILGRWNSKVDREFMLWDMNNFRGPEPGEGEFIYYTPLRNEFTGLQMQRGWMTADASEEESMGLVPALKWFKHEWQRVKNCDASRPKREVSPTFADSGNYDTLCTNDGLLLQRMTYRIDFIETFKLPQYIGSAYAKSINHGRKFGLELFQILKERDTASMAVINWNEENRTDYLTGERKLEIKRQLYWMTRKPKAAFVMVKSDFPWYWNLFKKVMKEDAFVKFAHTGPLELRTLRRDQGLGGNGFESPMQIQGPFFSHLPELDWMMRRMRIVAHSGLLGFFAKWDKILFPPLQEPMNAVIEESVTRARALSTGDDAITALFAVFFWGIVASVSTFVLEFAYVKLCNFAANKVGEIVYF